MNPEGLSSKTGLGTILSVVSLVVLLIFPLISLFDGRTTNLFPINDEVVAIGFLILGFLGIITLLSFRFTVKKESVISSSIWGAKEILIKDVVRIHIPNGSGWIPFLGFNVSIYPSTGFVNLFGTLFSNGHDLIKAVIEAAVIANPEVKIDRVLLSDYGEPPYGILEK